MDKLIALHTNYLDTILRECMLTNSKLVNLMHALFSTASQFCDFYAALENMNIQSNNEEIVLKQAQSLSDNFSKNFRLFLEAIQYYSARDGDYYLGNLFQRLDYNSFHTNNNQKN